LTTTGFILAMDTYGPISDNANGIFEMSGALKEGSGNEGAHKIVAKLDAVGNTTKALTKGFAIATAVIAATALFASFVQDAKLTAGIQVNLPPVFIGLLIGAAVPVLFSSFAIRAVGRAAGLLVEEVRRQFREIPGIMEGTNKPEYAKCVAIATTAAQKELLGPGILAIFTPILVAFAMGYNDPKAGAMALGGYLAGAIVSAQLWAVFMSNTGGAWDNAKKKIEEGLFGGKGTEFHKAAVIGDTVGDPLKDTAGPALNPLIKVMNLVGILIAPVAISPISMGARIAIVVGCLVLLTLAVSFSKRTAKEAL
jgi:K(+)-stimulated pyrophosphate-energized sodium pump